MNLETPVVMTDAEKSTTVEISMNLETNNNGNPHKTIYDSRNFNELGNPCFWGKFLVMLFVINGLQLKLSLFFQNCQMRILVKSRFYKN